MCAKKYSIIYADPPWSYRDKKGCDPAYGAMTYPTMSIGAIKNLPVSAIADTNCMLFLWATFPNLREALDVIDAWGFQYKTVAFTWVKTNKRQPLQQASFFLVSQICFLVSVIIQNLMLKCVYWAFVERLTRSATL